MHIRHRLASYLLLLACRLSHARFFRRAASWVARLIQGPLNPEELYAKSPVMEQKLVRGKPLKNARPDTAMLPDAHPESSELEKWLAKEAQ
jgi:hypothetical protein